MYSTNVNGQVLEFGTSGLLYRSNKLMYDRGTKSLWNQFLGKPAVGPLVGSGIKLKILPVVVTTWGEWVDSHPDTTVLDIETGIYRPAQYEPEWEGGSIYYYYRTSPETMFPVWQKSDRLPTKGQVLGLKVGGEAKAYPLNLFETQTVINDTLGGENLVVFAEGKSGGARAYHRDSHEFTLEQIDTADEGLPVLVDEGGHRWRVEEEALVRGDDSTQRLQRLPSHTAYWFGWYSFYPNTQIYLTTDPLP